MLTFTLDTNCIIAVEELRPESAAIERLVAAHRSSRADVGLVAISASERQRDGAVIEDFAMFNERLARLGLDALRLLKPMGYWGVTFWDFSLWSDDDAKRLELRIHEILFPSMEFNWIDYAQAHGLDPSSVAGDARWRNAKCDVQAFWSHVSGRRDVFVTSDKNFHAAMKKPMLLALAGGHIEFPEGAAALVGESGDAA